jgi:hypothetical protein
MLKVMMVLRRVEGMSKQFTELKRKQIIKVHWLQDLNVTKQTLTLFVVLFVGGSLFPGNDMFGWFPNLFYCKRGK